MSVRLISYYKMYIWVFQWIFSRLFIPHMTILNVLIAIVKEFNKSALFWRPISPPHGSQVVSAGNRRFRSRSPQPRSSRIRGRSPERYGRSARSRSISPDRIRRRSFSRSRSRSPGYPRSRIQMSPDPPGYVPSAKAPRCRDYDEKGKINHIILI